MEEITKIKGMTIHGVLIRSRLRSTLKLIDHREESDNSLRFAELNFIDPEYQRVFCMDLPVDIEEVTCSLKQKCDIKIKLKDAAGEVFFICRQVELNFKNIM